MGNFWDWGDCRDEADATCALTAAGRARRGYRGYQINSPAILLMEHCRLADVRQWKKEHPYCISDLACLLAAALRSSTPDAPAKAAWVWSYIKRSRMHWHSGPAKEAAKRGDISVLDALAGAGCPVACVEVVEAAAGANQVAALAWLLERFSPDMHEIRNACSAAAKGGGLEALRLLLPLALAEYARVEGRDEQWQWGEPLSNLQRGFVESAVGMAAQGGNLAAVRLLQFPGIRINTMTFSNAVQSGAVEVARFLVQQSAAAVLGWREGREDLLAALGRADLAMAAFLVDEAQAEWPPPAAALEAALSAGTPAGRGRDGLGVLAWLRARGCPLACDVAALRVAGREGSLEAFAWLEGEGLLRRRDLVPAVFEAAAEGGCAALLQWLADRGCPAGDAGRAYVAAGCVGDMCTLRCLRRMGVPWGGDTFLLALDASSMHGDRPSDMRPPTCCPLRVLEWMYEQGMPVDERSAELVAAKVAAEELHVGVDLEEVMKWMRRMGIAAD